MALLTRHHPDMITSYDLLKSVALALMIIDHIGAFFFPEQYGWRVVGRMSAPVWLFLIGYAQTRELSPSLWVGTFILVAGNFALGQPLLPLCILATFLAARAVLDPLMGLIRRKPSSLYVAAAALFGLNFVTMPLIEYGSAAFYFVMIGYFVRHSGSMPFDKEQRLQFAVIAAGLYAVFQLGTFMDFTMAQKLVTGCGLIGTALLLTRFRPVTYEALSRRLPAICKAPLYIGGRWTLEIYVAHLLLFKVISVMGAENPPYFNLHIF
ncbi:MAG: TraX family protein [Micavibrio sp.]